MERERTAPQPTGYDVARVRADWIGCVVASSQGRYPVEFDPIRRYCHMTGDTNPLFLDPDAAAQCPHGAVIAPLPLVAYFAGNGPWPRRDVNPTPSGFTYGVPTPGDRGINMSVSWDYLEPARIGDRLRAEVRIADIFVKPIRLDPEAVWITTETQIFRHDNQLLVRIRNTVLVHRAPEQIERQQ
jgi:acyl dehydratase